MDDATRFSRSQAMPAAEVGEEIVFLHQEEGAYYGLEGVGAFVWRLLEVPRTFKDLVDSVTAEYDVDEETCRKDLEDFMRALVERGLVKASDSGA